MRLSRAYFKRLSDFKLKTLETNFVKPGIKENTKHHTNYWLTLKVNMVKVE